MNVFWYEMRFKYRSFVLKDKEFQKEKDKISYNLLLLCKGNFLKKKRIFIFGVNNYLDFILNELNKNGYSAEAILDNNESFKGKFQNGIPVCKPEDVLFPLLPDGIILISSMHFDKMCEQLVKLGYSRKRNIIRLMNFPSPAKRAYNRKKELAGVHAAKAFCEYIKIKQKYGYETQLFLVTNYGLGDLYYIIGYLPDYVEKKKIKNYYVLALSGMAFHIGKLFGESKISILDDQTMKYLIMLGDLLNDEKIMVMHWTKKGEVLPRIHRNDAQFDVPFNITYQYAVFGGKYDLAPVRYHPPRDAVSLLFQEKGLHPGKTVILAPASNTITALNRDIWSEIISFLKMGGFTVCTNVIHGKEEALPGTVPMEFLIEDAVSVCESAGYVIAMRSGFCDIISGASCKKIIIYTESVRLNNVYEVFSFERMHLGRNIREIQCGSDTGKRITDAIRKFFCAQGRTASR